MKLKLQIATPEDAPDLVALRNAVSQHLTSRFGQGHWSSGVTEKGVLFGMRRSTVYIARKGKRMVATLALSTRKPWAIDKRYFHASQRPLYLTAMAVEPGLQGKGVGRLCLEQARVIATTWPADAIRLDAYDADAGAGEFYRKCGFGEVGRAAYRTVPLIYFEMLL
jgi:GNAT superfamily N-acetyltransferase